MRQNILDAPSEKGSVAILVYLLKGEGVVFKYNLRYATGSLRKVNNALKKLEAAHLVLVRDSSVGKKKLYPDFALFYYYDTPLK